MKENLEANFNIDNINTIDLSLLEGQIDLILRSMELYGYNLEYMLDSTDSNDETKQEKIALLKYTYEQILASKSEQSQKSNNSLNNLTKNMLTNNNIIDIIPKFKAM